MKIKMCDVTSKNFNKVYPEIIDQLQTATFIAFDCEFSGLVLYDQMHSLFDTPKARFNKLQKSLENYKIIQFGMTIFKYERTNNTFLCSTYNFFITPTAVLENQNFSSQMQSIKFLCKNKFDFNKLFYDGICYLNKSNEAALINKIENGNLLILKTNDIERDLQKHCSKVAEWNGTATVGSEMELKLDDETDTFIYLLHQEIRKRFHNVWTYFGENNSIKIRKVDNCERRLLLSSKEKNITLKKKLLESILGFSRIIREIEKLKKPIVGHNILTDLIMIYRQFYNPSLISYSQFKKSISELFPNIYDTKLISFKLRDLLTKENSWNTNILSDLYHYFRDGKGSTLVIFSPSVKHTNEEFLKTEQFHNAGFDSYTTGFCFLKMAHVLSLWDKQKKTFLLTSFPTSSSWLISAVAPMKNHVNISRAQVKYISLDDEDPKSFRPGTLYIQSKNNQPLDVSKISSILAKQASVDIQLLSKYTALMAVGNSKQVTEILECFKNHKEFKVTKYNFLKYSDLGRAIVSVTFIASLVFSVILIKNYS